jgi:hypothetical protein
MERLAEHWRNFKVTQMTALRMLQTAQGKMPVSFVEHDYRFDCGDDAKRSSKLAAQAILSPTQASLCYTTLRPGGSSVPPPAFSRGGPAGSFRQCWMSQTHRY